MSNVYIPKKYGRDEWKYPEELCDCVFPSKKDEKNSMSIVLPKDMKPLCFICQANKKPCGHPCVTENSCGTFWYQDEEGIWRKGYVSCPLLRGQITIRHKQFGCKRCLNKNNYNYYNYPHLPLYCPYNENAKKLIVNARLMCKQCNKLK